MCTVVSSWASMNDRGSMDEGTQSLHTNGAHWPAHARMQSRMHTILSLPLTWEWPQPTIPYQSCLWIFSWKTNFGEERKSSHAHIWRLCTMKKNSRNVSFSFFIPTFLRLDIYSRHWRHMTSFSCWYDVIHHFVKARSMFLRLPEEMESILKFINLLYINFP